MKSEEISQPCSFLELHTDEAIVFKSISKVLHKNFIDTTLLINQFGIYISENTDDAKVLIECILNAEYFTKFMIPQLEEGQTIRLGLSTTDFCQATSGITKTDKLKISVIENDYNTLCIQILNPDRGKKVHKFIKLKQVEIKDLCAPQYNNHLPTATIVSSQFKRAMVDANKVSKQKVRIRAQKKGALMENSESQIASFREEWGEWVEGEEVIFDKYLITKRLHSITELSQITKNVRIYATADDSIPMKLSCHAGGLGFIYIYLTGTDE